MVIICKPRVFLMRSKGVAFRRTVNPLNSGTKIWFVLQMCISGEWMSGLSIVSPTKTVPDTDAQQKINWVSYWGGGVAETGKNQMKEVFAGFIPRAVGGGGRGSVRRRGYLSGLCFWKNTLAAIWERRVRLEIREIRQNSHEMGAWTE